MKHSTHRLSPLVSSKKGLLLFVTALAAAVVGLSCTSRKAEPPVAEDVSRLFQEIENSDLFLYEGSQKVWRLESKYMRKAMSDTGQIAGTPVRLSLYDSLGGVRSIVLGDSGTTNAKKDQFTVWGNVYVRTEDSIVVRAEQLSWSAGTHKVTSEKFVEITTPTGDVLRGRGLDAAEDFSWWTLRHNVSGEFPNFRKRMESEEEFDFGLGKSGSSDNDE